RRSYARIEEKLDLPNLIEIQTKSYDWFLKTGLIEMFKDISPVEDFTGNMSLEFVDYKLGEPKYDEDEAKNHDATYSAPLRVKVRLVIKETGEVKEQEVFMGDFLFLDLSGLLDDKTHFNTQRCRICCIVVLCFILIIFRRGQ